MTKRVLLVEDDADLRRLLAKLLSRAGYEVVEASDGKEAEHTLAGEAIDLMISDLVMPGMDGIELMMDVRRRYPSLKIVAMSGGGHTGTGSYLSVARALGACRTLSKPFEASQLIEVVRAELAA